MIPRLGTLFARWARLLIPDPMVIAVGLTALTAVLALLLTAAGPVDVLRAWAGPRGVFNLLGFGMQMCLILVTGHALASSRPVAWALAWLAGCGHGARQVTALTALVAVTTGLLNWGLGLIVGALFAREVGRRAQERGLVVHYPLLAAAGYTGLLVWHGGLSGSAPLTVTRLPDVEKLLGSELAARVGEIALSRTLLSPMNLVVAVALIVLVPLLCAALVPAVEQCQSAADFISTRDEVPAVEEPMTGFAARLDHSRGVTAILVVIVAAGAVLGVSSSGFMRLDLNMVILIFLALGLALHGTPRRYVGAVQGAIGGTAGIVLQFPLYAGIMGIMAGTGLVDVFAHGIVSVASARSFPVFNFFSAAVVNLFVPSGGGQWAVQGPISVQAALQLGVPVERAVMSLAYGDQLTNMLQPFWALPLLGITGVKAHHVIGYTAVLMLLTVPLFVLALLVLP
ncbi:MAG: TIGR00366 family protein [Pseudomonadota bacterium]